MFAFLLIGSIGFLMLVVTWFVGELFDFGHDVASFFGDHLGSVDVDGHHVEIGHPIDAVDHGPSPLSSRVLFTFMTAFGGGGAVASIYGIPTVPSVLVGIVSGLVIGGGTFLFARLIWKQQSSSGFEIGSLVGRQARVIVAIPEGGAGQVSIVAGGGSSTLLARTKTGGQVGEGAVVRVVDVQGDLLLVETETTASSKRGEAIS